MSNLLALTYGALKLKTLPEIALELSVIKDENTLSEFDTSAILAGYKKAHEEISAFFSLGAANRSGATIESMDKNLLALNYFSNEIIGISYCKTLLESMAINATIGKVFRIGNCERQAFTSFMHFLTNGHLNKSLELIIIKGKSLIGNHRCLLADRESSSDINQPPTWHGAAYVDSWNGEFLFEESLTALSKEEFAKKGAITGDIRIRSLYRREMPLSRKECLGIIDCLKRFKSSITKERITSIRLSSPAIDYLQSIDDNQLHELIHRQIDEDIRSYSALVSEKKPVFFTSSACETAHSPARSATSLSNTASHEQSALSMCYQITPNITLKFSKANDGLGISLGLYVDGVKKIGLGDIRQETKERIIALHHNPEALIAYLSTRGSTARKMAKMIDLDLKTPSITTSGNKESQESVVEKNLLLSNSICALMRYGIFDALKGPTGEQLTPDTVYDTVLD